MRAAFGGTLATQFDTVARHQVRASALPARRSRRASRPSAAIPVAHATAARIAHLGDVAQLRARIRPQPLITRINRETVIHVSRTSRRARAVDRAERAFCGA